MQLADELSDAVDALGAYYARLDLRFDPIERWDVSVEDGHVRLRAWHRGTQVSWMPEARRAFEAQRQSEPDQAVD